MRFEAILAPFAAKAHKFLTILQMSVANKLCSLGWVGDFKNVLD
jgi:hypothetical protein